jgi:hypothetical protein
VTCSALLSQWTTEQLSTLRGALEPLVEASRANGSKGCVRAQDLREKMLHCQTFWPSGDNHNIVASAIDRLGDFHFKHQHQIHQPGGGRKNKASVIVPGPPKVSAHTHPCNMGPLSDALPRTGECRECRRCEWR